MTLSAVISTENTREFARFERLLSSDATERPLYDQIMFELAGCVVAPTLGSIIPHWLLIVPREPCTNFRQWRSMTGHEPADVVAAVLSKCLVDPADAIWFEHGSTEIGSSVGCGVDHAHLHVLLNPPFTLGELLDAANNTVYLDWAFLAASDAHASVDPHASYILAACGGRAAYAHHVRHVGSQYLRKAVATVVGCPDSWNYKTHPHLPQVQATVDLIRPLGAR